MPLYTLAQLGSVALPKVAEQMLWPMEERNKAFVCVRKLIVEKRSHHGRIAYYKRVRAMRPREAACTKNMAQRETVCLKCTQA